MLMLLLLLLLVWYRRPCWRPGGLSVSCVAWTRMEEATEMVVGSEEDWKLVASIASLCMGEQNGT